MSNYQRQTQSDYVMIDQCFVNEAKPDFVHKEIVFDANILADLMVKHKDVFEANKGRMRLSLCHSKNKAGHMYVTLSTWKPTQQQQVTPAQHMPDRGNDKGNDLPF